jgi:hypothetical protein
LKQLATARGDGDGARRREREIPVTKKTETARVLSFRPVRTWGFVPTRKGRDA